MMKHIMIKRSIILLFAVIFFVTSQSHASQPMPPQVVVKTELSRGAVMLALENFEKFPIIIEFHPGPLTTVKFSQTRITLEPGQRAELKLTGTNFDEGRQVLHAESTVQTERGGKTAGPAVHETIIVSRGVPRKISFEEAFLARRQRTQNAQKSDVPKVDLGGYVDTAPISPLAFKALGLPVGSKVQPLRFLSPLEYSKLKPRQLPRPSDPRAGAPRGTTPNIESPGDLIDILEPLETETNASDAPSDMDIFKDITATSTLTVRGNMSLQIAPGSFKAAWGWVVKAWQWQTSNWRFLGWAYVGGDGNWSIDFASNLVVQGVPVRVEYLTKNRFISLQDASSNPYAWGDDWTLSGAITDIGSRYADLTVNGDLPGADQLYVGATNVWVKFYNTGMNALRDEPIQITFPNSLASGQCINTNAAGTKFAWSCSYWADGRIYIIPAHADPAVAQHEIGHSINSFYWNGDMPDDSGGQHSLTGCFTNGLALTEGFGDFLAYWVQLDRNSPSPSISAFNMNLETLPNTVCNGQTNEMRVAATFWDLYDYWNDGSGNSVDSLLYTDQASVVSIYLNNKKGKMADYLGVVQSGQNAYWQSELTKLFRLNTIVP